MAFDEGVALGKKARVEEWSEDWLDVEFGLWVEERQNSGWGGYIGRKLKKKHKRKRVRAEEATRKAEQETLGKERLRTCKRSE